MTALAIKLLANKILSTALLRGTLIYFLINIGSKTFLAISDDESGSAETESKIINIESTRDTLKLANAFYIASQIIRSIL